MGKQKSKDLTIKFANQRAAHHFWVWLCESGEQEYWQWMEAREQEEDGDITALRFEYGTADSGVISAKCGRLDG